MKNIIYCLQLWALLFSCASFAITNGQPISDSDSPYVVFLEDTAWPSFCTAVVVGPGTILTASHCVRTPDLKAYHINQQEGLVQSIFVAPIEENQENTVDLALIKVDPKLFKDILPIAQKMPTPPFDETLIGYGLAYKPGLPLTEDESVVRRVGHSRTEDPKNISDLFIFHMPEFTPYDASKPSGVLEGDSGGPLIVDGKVIGIAVKIGLHMNLLGKRPQRFLKLAQKKGFQIQYSK